jgi:asparagine synthase (glutamine-hydrolysing)
MWAFAIWDPRNKTLFFSRDRLGEKPFYWATTSKGFMFASEPKALLAVDHQLRQINKRALHGFLAEGQLYTTGESFYKGIQVLRPGTFGTFKIDESSPEIQTFWEPGALAKEPTYDTALQEFTSLFLDSVRLRMRSDVRVGITLSGGLDSTAVLDAMAEGVLAEARVPAFTATYEGSFDTDQVGEVKWARSAASALRHTDLTEVPASSAGWIETLMRIVWHMDGPGYSPAVYPLWEIMKRARQSGVSVVLEGQGADELLGGYPRHAAQAMRDAMSKEGSGTFGTTIVDFAGYARTFGRATLGLWVMRQCFPQLKLYYRKAFGALGVLSEDFSAEFAEASPIEARTLRERLNSDLTRDILPGLLHYGDAISMAHGVESRMPFLDYRLVDFCTALPNAFKLGNGWTKRILRDHLRARNLPNFAARRSKLGFPTPAYSWMLNELSGPMREILLNPSALIGEFTNGRKVAALINGGGLRPRGTGNHLYRLLTTELWLQSVSANK